MAHHWAKIEAIDSNIGIKPIDSIATQYHIVRDHFALAIVQHPESSGKKKC